MKRKLEELRQLDISDIRHKLDALQKEIYDLRYQAQTARVDKPHRFKELHKEIARCKTVIREKGSTDAGNR